MALSTAEAEYVALSAAAQEAVWLQQLTSDLLNKSIQETTIREDNQSAICLTKNQQVHGRTKHIDIKYNFIRDMVEAGRIKLKYCVRLLCRLLANFWLLTSMFSRLLSLTLGPLKMVKSLCCAETTHHSKAALRLNVLHIV